MNPYFAILRSNRNFRLLFLGQTVSQLGDWFNAVAIYALVLDLTDSATAVAWLMVAQLLPMAIVGPLAGVIVDRFDRRRLMMAADVIRGVLVLGLLVVRRPDQVWIAYAVSALLTCGTAVFEPARTATIPNLTTAEELVPANALSSAAWSAMLAIGASIGGLVTAIAGRNAAFTINAASFFVSVAFIARTRYDARPPAVQRAAGWAEVTGFRDIAEGLGYVHAQPHVAALMFVKAGWGLAGGVLLLLTIFGERVFPVHGSTAAGIGVLYGARGVGAGLGPIVLRWILGQEPRTLRRSIAPAYLVVAVFYVGLGVSPTLLLAAASVLLAHVGGSILWVFSTVLLQLEVPDRFRGRVFAAELMLVSLTTAASSFLTALAVDRGGWSPRATSVTLGLLFCVPAAIWALVEWRWVERPPAKTNAAAATSGAEEVLEGRVG